jgi:hypothetical protein
VIKIKVGVGNLVILKLRDFTTDAINTFMKNIITSIVSTNKGWFVRQILKYAAVGGTALSTWLISKGADSSSVELITTGLITLVSGGLELFFSKLASKIAAK